MSAPKYCFTKHRFTKFLTLVCATFLLASCASKPKSSGNVASDAELTTSQRAPITGIEEYNAQPIPQGPIPGSQQDLVVNVGDRIFFEYNQHDLTLEARGQVERQAEWLQRYSNIAVTVEGHADERGTREYNLGLGEKRAQSIRSYMIALGINPGRINVISYGKERPAVVGSNPTSWAQNRRGVVVVE